MMNYGKQFIDDDDIASVIEVLKSDFLTQGPKVKLFENAISNYVGSKFAVAVNSASSALHIACLAIDLKKGDIFWTVPNTFVASANCGLHCGAKVDFVDIDRETLNISVKNLEQKLILAHKNNLLPKVLITVHFAGQPTMQKEIFNLSKKYKFKIIEDASHSLGALKEGETVGSCKWSDISVFSFHPVKMITTAEGGMAVTNDRNLANKMKSLRTHGIVREEDFMIQKNQPSFYYEQKFLGFNYRMNDISAALGISQLKKIEKFVQKRNDLARCYDDQFKDFPFSPQKILKNTLSSYHLYVITLEKDFLKMHSRNVIYEKLNNQGIKTNLHYLPVHLHPFYKSMGFNNGYLPVAENYAISSLSIPLYYSMTESDQEKVIQIFHKIFK